MSMTLPNDVARCPGVGSEEEGWREGCEDCYRRTSKPHQNSMRWVWMEPPPIIAFECEFRIDTPNADH